MGKGYWVLMVIIGGLTTAFFFFGPKHLLLPSRSSRRETAEDYLVSDTDTRSYTEDGSFYIVLLYNWLVGDFNPLDFAAFLER